MSHVTCSFHLAFRLKDRRYPHLGLNIPKVTKGKPTLGRGEIAVRLELRVPRSLFDEFIPSGVIEIPEDAQVGRPAVVVEVPEFENPPPGLRLRLCPIEEASVELAD